MNPSIKLPDNISLATFLSEYWQKKPLFMPAAIAGFTDPLEPDELAGLACEEGIASRIVIEHGNDQWQTRNGPFTEDSFAELPTDHWVLLVQDVNRYIRELDQLLSRFNFIPDWRIDDVMVSYAEPHGSVGPHVDQYDVFLLQGLGSRRWQISQAECGALVPDIDLRILKDFTPEQEFIMQPGDVLYLPAGVQHHGVGDEVCMTYSIGFRAPDQFELLSDYVDDCILNNVERLPRYTDHSLTGSKDSGEITAEALNKIVQQIKQIPSTETAIQHWFGAFITSTNQTAESIPMLVEEDPNAAFRYIDKFKAALKQHSILYRDIESRFAYINQSSGIELFVNGASLVIADERAALARYLCNHRQYQLTDIEHWLNDDASMSILCAWWQHDLLSFEDDG